MYLYVSVYSPLIVLVAMVGQMMISPNSVRIQTRSLDSPASLRRGKLLEEKEKSMLIFQIDS
jgi:hypothetical protein